MKTHFLNQKDKRVKGFFITEIGYKNTYDFSVYHRHDYFEIFLFETGFSGKQNIDFVAYSIKQKHLYFVTPGQVHLLQRHKNESGFLIQFTREFLDLCIAPSKINFTSLFQENNALPLSDSQFQIIKCLLEQLKENYEIESTYYYQKITKLFGYFIFSLLEHLPDQTTKTKNNLTNSFYNLVKNEVQQHRQVSYYANKLNVSPNKLALETKQQFGKSPLKIIHQELLLEIKRQLIFNNKSHKELAFDFYFDDLSTYSRFIKAQTGMSPTEFKSQFMEIVKA